MALRLPKILNNCVVSRRRLVVALLSLGFVLPLLLLLAAPAILSSSFVQNRLKVTLSTALHGPVSWSSLQLSWRRGLQLRDLTVGPATGALQQARLAAIDCRPGFGFGAKRSESFGLDLYLHLQDLQLELAPPATSPAPSPPPPAAEQRDPLTTLAQGLDRFATLSWPLPIDLRIDVAVTPITIRYHDPASGHHLLFEEGDFQVKIPSLEQAPLTVSLNGRVAVDDHPLGPFRLATEVAGLVAPSGRLVPARGLFTAFVDFPGLTLKADGRLDQGQGVRGELRLDLPQLQGVAAPFLPASLPEFGGNLLATLHATVDAEEDLALSCTLAGNKLRAAAVGPLDFNLAQQVRTDHRRQLVTLGGGVLMIPQLLDANWEASVEEPNSPERRVRARLHQLEIDLDRALALAAPLLPPALPRIDGGHLQLRDLDLQLRGGQGDGELHLANAALALQSLRLAVAGGELAVAGIELAASDLAVPLTAYFPASVDAGIEWKIAALDLGGAQPLSLGGIDGSGNLTIAALRPAAGEGRLSANGRFDHQLRLKTAAAAGLARLGTLVNDLHLAFALQPDGAISISSLGLNTEIATLTATVAGKELPPLPLRQSLQVTGMELHPDDVLPLVKSIDFSLTSPGFVKVEASGGLEAERRLTLATRTRLELARFMALAAPLLPEKMAASGAISTGLQLVATIPDRPLPSGQAPLRSAKGALALLEELRATLQLDALEVRMPLADGNLHLSGIQTTPALSLQSARGGNQIDFSGAVDFDLRSGSSVGGKVLPAAHGRLTGSGELRDWDRAFLAETVQIEPLGLAERTELTITGLAALLDTALPPPPAALLQRLDATLFSEIEVKLPAVAQLLPELTMSGTTTAGSRVDLLGGKSLRLHAYADVADLALTSAKGLQLQGLQAHLTLDRALEIRSAASAAAPWRPLSLSLVQPQPPPLPAPLAEVRQRLQDDLRGSSGGKRSLSIQSLLLTDLPLPLTVQALEAEIASGQEEAGLNFLQAELLGGTLRARALLDLRPFVPVLSAEALFTNLDLDRVGTLGGELRPGAEESSISGEGSLRLPLFDERRAFLEGLALSARLRHVGSKSLDRLHARLDPRESNEAIQAQRKLLRLGHLQRAAVEVSDGALSVSGAVNVKDVSIPLPKIDRLRLSELPLHKELAPLLAAIGAARPPLEFVRADTIVIGAQGEITLRKEDQ